MKTISKASHAQYVISHRHCTRSRPMGLTKVVKKPAVREKNWKMVIPLVR
jgi:hypothetical protein